MIHRIGSNDYMSYLQTQTARSRPDPAEMFNKVDSDGSCGISQSELETFAQDISSKTGNSMDTTDAISTYDADGDGELSEDELKSFMEASAIKPPPPPPGGACMMGGVDSEDETSTTSADSVISPYDTDGNGMLSSEELQGYLDNNNTASFQTLVRQALSAYTMGFGSGGFSNLDDTLFSLGGYNDYSPVDLLA